MEDYSENKDKGYLADGLTEAITLELSKNEAIRVISRSSAMKFKGKKTLASEMAHELKVDLLLESSLFTYNNELRVVVQLIEPFPKEKHIWANSYQQKTSNILQLVSNVSNEIAKEICSAVQTDSKEPKNYKVDPEAFDYYLKGRHIWNNQKTRYTSLKNAQDYLNISISIDSNFAPAHVTLAETLISLNMLIGDNEERLINRENARKSIDKAFEIDQTLAEAYITKANLIGKLDWDWERMKTLAEKGLTLDPNNPYGHHVLSNYYIVKGNYEKAIKEALIAESFDPLNPSTGSYVAECYYIAGQYDQSLTKYNEVLELYPDFGYALNGIGFVYLQFGNRKKTIESWQKLQQVMGNDQLGKCYDISDFENCLNYYLESAKMYKPQFCSNPTIISSVQMIIGDITGAVDYLKIAYKYKNEDLPIKMAYPDFNSLHNNPAFIEMAQQVGVVITN
jgi:TolB-like protein/Tfp pilus assembly protein PilF